MSPQGQTHPVPLFQSHTADGLCWLLFLLWSSLFSSLWSNTASVPWPQMPQTQTFPLKKCSQPLRFSDWYLVLKWYTLSSRGEKPVVSLSPLWVSVFQAKGICLQACTPLTHLVSLNPFCMFYNSQIVNAHVQRHGTQCLLVREYKNKIKLNNSD